MSLLITWSFVDSVEPYVAQRQIILQYKHHTIIGRFKVLLIYVQGGQFSITSTKSSVVDNGTKEVNDCCLSAHSSLTLHYLLQLSDGFRWSLKEIEEIEEDQSQLK